jgi:ribosomal protein L37AE/L43A
VGKSSAGHLCPDCGTKTTYRGYSGGREWYCGACGADGSYRDGQAPVRAALLQSEAGRAGLRAQMDAAITLHREQP